MKKVFLSALLAVTAMQSVNALAVWNPLWERPILKADMIETDVAGHEITPHLKKELTMHKRDGAKNPTMLTLVEEKQVYCFRAPCPPIKMKTTYKLEAPKDAGCGSRLLTGVSGNTRLSLVDHSTRLCDDYKKYRWEAKLTSQTGTRHLSGNPEGVITIQ